MLHFNTRRVTVAVMIYTVFSSVTSCPLNCKKKTNCNEPDDGCPECKTGWYGRKCEHPLECYTGVGTTYNGTTSISENNITCQHWSSQTPNAHPWGGMDSSENYCRHPNIHGTEPKPWCYQIEGDRGAMCNIPKCEDQCPAPILPVFGNVINPPPKGFSIGFVLHVNGSCGPGQQINMTCQDNKAWLRTNCLDVPWCARPNVTEPSYISSVQSTFYYKDVLRVFCKTGYEMSGGNYDLIRCEENRMWSNIPICERITCIEPVLNENSYISAGNGTSYIYGEKIRVVCVEGFEAIGESQFECKANGEWNGTFPYCRMIECPEPGRSLKEHSIITNDTSRYLHGTTITIQCREGYEPQGQTHFRCEADSSWNGTFPHCNPLNKSTKLDLPNVQQKCYPSGAIGESQFECKANGEWNGTFPYCRMIECPEPRRSLKEHSIITNDTSRYPHGTTITIQCREGYEPQGQTHFRCEADSSWNGTFPHCNPSDAIKMSRCGVSSDAMASIGISCVSTIVAVTSIATTVCYVIR